MKEDFFLKFKDYNKELENILEEKDFSEDVKNLLLSMFYKLDVSYNDYFIVKRLCKTKQKYLEEILEKIKETNNIELVKINDKDYERIKQKETYEVDLKTKKIKVIENELAIFAALLELNNFEIRLTKGYNLIKNAMPYFFNTAYDMENIEVLRDFNAWSWNTVIEEIKDIDINLVYQNLRMALNTNIFNEAQNSDDNIIDQMENIINKLYNEKIAEKFIQLIYKISIIKYLKIDKNEAKRLIKAKETLELELETINDKKAYLEKISSIKKQLAKDLKEIDLILNTGESKLVERSQIFNPNELKERVKREKIKILRKIDLCNKNMSPNIYLENKHRIEKEYDILSDIELEKENQLDEYINKLQEIFIKDIFLIKLEHAITREEIINCMYELRYYNFLPYNKETIIKDVSDFKKYIEEVEEKLIKKLYDNKIINNISTNEKNDIQIIKNIFDLKIINMESIYIELRRKTNSYIISIYDEKETLEKELEIELEFNEQDKIKLNKKIKLFKMERK